MSGIAWRYMGVIRSCHEVDRGGWELAGSRWDMWELSGSKLKVYGSFPDVDSGVWELSGGVLGCNDL